jgi:hypothetical protein
MNTDGEYVFHSQEDNDPAEWRDDNLTHHSPTLSCQPVSGPGLARHYTPKGSTTQ